MRPVLLSICALLILAACGGGTRPDDAAELEPVEPMPGDVIDGQVFCEVGALKWREDGLLTVAFWCDQSEGWQPGDPVAMVDRTGTVLAQAQVHRTSPEQGAMSLRIRGDELQGDIVRGTEFMLALP